MAFSTKGKADFPIANTMASDNKVLCSNAASCWLNFAVAKATAIDAIFSGLISRLLFDSSVVKNAKSFSITGSANALSRYRCEGLPLATS